MVKPVFRDNSSSKIRLIQSKLASIIVLLVTAIACTAPNPSHPNTIPANWGSHLVPAYQDIAYLPAPKGCELTSKPADRCGQLTTLDIYPHRQGASRGVIVFMHGGGFFTGDKKHKDTSANFGPILRQTQRGWDVVSINYRLADHTRSFNMFPTAIQDVQAALRWVKAEGPAYGINPTRIVTAGHSAGATLAVLVATGANSTKTLFANTPPISSGYIGIAGVYNFEISGNSRWWGALWMARNYPTQWQSASPATWLDATDPPGYLAHGDLDSAVDVANAHDMNTRALNGGFASKLTLDIVDRYTNGTFMPDSLRGHNSAGGINTVEFDRYLDSLQ